MLIKKKENKTKKMPELSVMDLQQINRRFPTTDHFQLAREAQQEVVTLIHYL